MACCTSSGPQEGLAPAISAQECACHLSSNPGSEAPFAEAALIVTPNSKRVEYNIVVRIQSVEAIFSASNKHPTLKTHFRPKVDSNLKLYDLLSTYLI